MHSLGRRHATVGSRRTNGQRAESREEKLEEVERRLGEMFELKQEEKKVLFTVCLNVAGFSDGEGWFAV